MLFFYTSFLYTRKFSVLCFIEDSLKKNVSLKIEIPGFFSFFFLWNVVHESDK